MENKKQLKDYIVSLTVSFDTPLTVNAKTETEAKKKGKEAFKKIFDEFKKKLDDITELNIEVEYAETDDFEEVDEDEEEITPIAKGDITEEQREVIDIKLNRIRELSENWVNRTSPFTLLEILNSIEIGIEEIKDLFIWGKHEKKK